MTKDEIDSTQAKKVIDKYGTQEFIMRVRLAAFLGVGSMTAVEDFIVDCWAAWSKHPDFKKPNETKVSWAFSDVVLMAVYSHPPGKYDHTESYVIGSLSTIFSNHEWAMSKWKAEFSRLQPIVKQVAIPNAINWMKKFEPHEYDEVIEIDPEAIMYQNIFVDPHLVTTIPYSYAGQGAQMTARLRLKALLPSRLQKWVSKARSGNAKPKHFYFSKKELTQWYGLNKNGKRIIKYPKEIRAIPKWKLWFDKHVPLDIQDDLKQYITLEDFWRCATGKVHPNDIDTYFVPPLFRGHVVDLGDIRPSRKRKQNKDAKTEAGAKQLSLLKV